MNENRYQLFFRVYLKLNMLFYFTFAALSYYSEVGHAYSVNAWQSVGSNTGNNVLDIGNYNNCFALQYRWYDIP